MSEGEKAPLVTCLYCKKICKFRMPATRVTTVQAKFLLDVLSEIKTGMLGNAVKITMLKSAELMNQQFNPVSGNQIGLSYCIFAHIVDELSLLRDLKELLMKNVQKTLLYMFKKAKALVQQGELKIPSNSPGTTAGATTGQITSSKNEDLQGESFSKQTSSNLDQDSLAAKRAAIRQKMMGSDSQSKKTSQKKGRSRTKGAGPQEETLSLKGKVSAWLENDLKFMKIVAPEGIKKLPTKFLILFDPESEGYLSKLKIDFAEKHITTEQGIAKDVIKLRWTSTYDVKYNQDVAIGVIGGKKVIAVTFMEPIPTNVNELMDAFRQASMENPTDWDPLQIILNNDKRLKKMIVKDLPLRSPAPGYVDDILVPISLIRAEGNMKIILKCFASKDKKPSKIFNIMETIAEDLDNLYELDESVRTRSAKDSGLFDFSSTERTSMDDFHFLATSGPIEIPTCPFCGRPFPDTEADYRRCPFCLEKLR